MTRPQIITLELEDCSEALVAYVERLELANVTKWVSIQEAFPTEPKQVMICYLKPNFGVPKQNYTTAYFEYICGWSYWDTDKKVSYPITHWADIRCMDDE